jgi:hypothetical protein
MVRSGLSNLGGYELYDLVTMAQNETAVVTRVAQEYLEVSFRLRNVIFVCTVPKRRALLLTVYLFVCYQRTGLDNHASRGGEKCKTGRTQVCALDVVSKLMHILHTEASAT